VDIDRARRESPFGTTIAHGFLTLSLLAGRAPAGAGSVSHVGHANAVNKGSDKLRVHSPVPARAKVHKR
jgi:acyl dehydratase